MEDLRLLEKKWHLDFAFVRYFSKKYPVFAERRMSTPDHNGSYHKHDFPQLWYCLGGHYFHKVGEQIYECTKGSVIMIPAGVCHKFRVPDGEYVELFYLNVMYDIFLDADVQKYVNSISALFLPSFAQELNCAFPTYQILSVGSQRALEEHTSWLSLLDYQDGTVEKTEIMDKLEQIFSLPEFALPESCRPKAVKLIQSRLDPALQMLRYLNRHYAENIQEEELLRAAGTCRTNLYRFFKQFTGCTYSQYLQELRAKHVHVYLSRTTYSLSYISDICGFCNTQHMSRTYKRYAGKTPKESRQYLYKLYNKKKGALQKKRRIKKHISWP